MAKTKGEETKTEPTWGEHKPKAQPTQQPRWPVPHHYRGKLSQNLDRMRKDGVIKDMGTRKPVNTIKNLGHTVKKAQGRSRRKENSNPIDEDTKMMRLHVKTSTKVCQELNNAESTVYFSELQARRLSKPQWQAQDEKAFLRTHDFGGNNIQH